MEKFTRLERAEIYLKCAESIANGEDEFCCIALLKYCPVLMGFLPSYFPELFAFNPGGGPAVWWGTPEIPENQSCRVLALLFCCEMALSPYP